MKPATKSIYQTMDSLALPPELLWNGKTEPTSPPSNDLIPLTEPLENWIYDDNFANDFPLKDDEIFELKPGFEIIHELINGDDMIIEFCDVKAENWTDTKFIPPLSPSLFNYGSTNISSNNLTPITKVQNVNFVDDFGSNVFDTAILTQLTPPHSPPQNVAVNFQTANNNSNNNAAILTELSQQQQQQQQITTTSIYNNNNDLSTPLVQNDNANNNFNINWPTTTTATTNNTTTTSNNTTTAATENNNNNNEQTNVTVTASIAAPGALLLSDDIAHQLVDEILYTRAQELPDFYDECNSIASSSSTTTDSSSTDDDSSPSYAPSTSSAGSSPIRYYNDELAASVASDALTTSGDSATTTKATSNVGGAIKKRTRPYGRGIEDRKIRKKEQNKNAATRYRQKKKLEMEYVLGEEQELLKRNEELKGILADRKRETKYLKNLLREFWAKQKQ